MKTLGFCFLLSFSALALSACAKSTAHFFITRSETVTLDSTATAGVEFSEQTSNIVLNVDAKCEKYRTRKQKIETAYVRQLKLTLTDTTQSFSFAEKAKVFLSAPGFGEINIASLDSIPADAGYTLLLNTGSADVKNFVITDKVKLRLELTSDEALPQSREISMRCRFFVSARQNRKKK
jgi:hypothetical protein